MRFPIPEQYGMMSVPSTRAFEAVRTHGQTARSSARRGRKCRGSTTAHKHRCFRFAGAMTSRRAGKTTARGFGNRACKANFTGILNLLSVKSCRATNHLQIFRWPTLRAANGLVLRKLIEDWALGGALAAIYYVRPFTTYDADIFFIPPTKGLSAGIPAIYAHLQSPRLAGRARTPLVRGFPVQFSRPAATEEAVREAERIEYESVPAKVFGPNTSWVLPPAWDGRKTRRASSKCSAGRPRQDAAGKNPATA